MGISESHQRIDYSKHCSPQFNIVGHHFQSGFKAWHIQICCNTQLQQEHGSVRIYGQCCRTVCHPRCSEQSRPVDHSFALAAVIWKVSQTSLQKPAMGSVRRQHESKPVH